MHYNLTSEIVKLSVSEYWDSAKLEWNFEYAYQSEDSQTCLCGHFPIRNICVIVNSNNKNQTEVGNCCVNKFFGIDQGNKIFSALNRLKGDLRKSLPAEVIEYLNIKKIITKYEYDFYMDTLRKRKLSVKQMEVRKKINQKFLDFTSYKADETLSKKNRMLKWAENNKWFDDKFIVSLKQAFERNGKLTDKQFKAIENIAERFKIE